MRITSSSLSQWRRRGRGGPAPSAGQAVGSAATFSLYQDSAMLSLVGRVASASASGALRGLSPSAALPQAQLLLRAAPAAVHPGKRRPRGGPGLVSFPRDLEPGPRGSAFPKETGGQRTAVRRREDREGCTRDCGSDQQRPVL